MERNKLPLQEVTQGSAEVARKGSPQRRREELGPSFGVEKKQRGWGRGFHEGYVHCSLVIVVISKGSMLCHFLSGCSEETRTRSS